jgi:hypothetical protein
LLVLELLLRFGDVRLDQEKHLNFLIFTMNLLTFLSIYEKQEPQEKLRGKAIEEKN